MAAVEEIVAITGNVESKGLLEISADLKTNIERFTVA